MSLATGQTLTHYEILGPLGAGAMADVYRARDTRLEREVALKVLPEELAADEERLRRFEHEAKVLASLNHPNVAQVFEIDRRGNTCFMAMELVRGEDLAQRLSRGALPLQEALELGRQIAEGVEAAHEAGVIHRDLKPANVLITPDGKPKVLDFGLAKPVAASEKAGAALTTEAGRLLGTPTYMAPEQVRGKSVDQRVDVWAFGCVLYECLTGRHAFVGETLGDVLAAVLEKEPDWSALPPGTPAHVLALLARCLDKDSRTRLQAIGEARIALQTTAGGAAEPAKAPSRPALSLPLLGLALLPTLVLAAALFLVLSRRSAAPPRNPLDAPVPRVLAFEGSQYDVAVSPDGDAVVFGSDHGGSVNLWRWSLQGGAPVNLTGKRVKMIDELLRNVGFRGSVPWVQDCESLALFKVQEPEELEPLPLLSAVEVVMSRDGRRVLYHTHEKGDPIFVHDEKEVPGAPLDRGGPGVHLHYPIWSTDEKWIYYAKGVPAIWAMNLWRIGVDGTEPQQLTFDQLDVAYPTPIDEDTVLFIARRPNGSGPCVFSLDVPSGQVQRATVGVEQYTALNASADGRTVVATRAAPTSSLFRIPVPGPQGERVREKDVERVAEVPEPGAHAPAVRGGRLFYLLSYGGGDGLYVAQGGRQRELWQDPNEPLLFPPSVSPSGDKVALVRRGAAVMKLAILDTSNGQLLADLETAVDVRGACTWSPDEEFLVIPGIGPDDRAGLFRIELESSTWVSLASGPALDPAWATDRDLIVFGINAGGGPRVAMRAVDREGREVDVDLSHMVPRFRLGAQVRFTPDGQGIVYLAYQNEPWTQQLFYLDLDSGESRPLTDLELNGTIHAFDLTPDGSHIVFDRVWQNSDVVVWDLAKRGD